jgi:predicted amidohydrolase
MLYERTLLAFALAAFIFYAQARLVGVCSGNPHDDDDADILLIDDHVYPSIYDVNCPISTNFVNWDGEGSTVTRGVMPEHGHCGT